MLRAIDAFNTMDMETTTQYQNDLFCRGVEGQLAFGLFRAQKRSTKAKGYRRGQHRHNSYAAKNEALQYVDAVLSRWGHDLELEWGWQTDPQQSMHREVLYVDFRGGYQCSFHSEVRHSSKQFPFQWDNMASSLNTVIEFCDQIILQNQPEYVDGDWLMPFGKHTGTPLRELPDWYVDWLSKWDGLPSWHGLDEYMNRVRPASPQKM